MLSRWRGRAAVLAIVVSALAASAAAVSAFAQSRAEIRVSLPNGRALAVLPLGDDGEFALRYRNSLYGTLAEERFRVADDGTFSLVGLEAEQLAVLEEYYAGQQPSRTVGGLGWRATPGHAPVIETLRVAATDRGERTLHVAGNQPLELWRFVDDHAPSILIEVSP